MCVAGCMWGIEDKFRDFQLCTPGIELDYEACVINTTCWAILLIHEQCVF